MVVGYVLKLIIFLFVIFMGCIFFINVVEWFGKKLNFVEGVVGSILVVVGIVLLEIIIFIIVIFFLKGESLNEVGIGVIVGVFFMFGIFVFFIIGLVVIVYILFKKRILKMNVDLSVFERDFIYFMIVYGIVVVIIFI